MAFRKRRRKMFQTQALSITYPVILLSMWTYYSACFHTCTLF